MPDKQPIIDFEPMPGYILIKSLKREEVAELYNRGGKSNLSLPDSVGKVSDSVGVGYVKAVGDFGLEIKKKLLDTYGDDYEKSEEYKRLMAIEPSTYIAHMPYTDLIIEIDGQKYSLLPYDKVWAVRKAQS